MLTYRSCDVRGVTFSGTDMARVSCGLLLRAGSTYLDSSARCSRIVSRILLECHLGRNVALPILHPRAVSQIFASSCLGRPAR